MHVIYEQNVTCVHVFLLPSNANSQGVVEEQYVFLKRVCQLLVHLGISQLAPLWVCPLNYKLLYGLFMHLHCMQQNKAGFQRPDTFEQYLNVVLEFTKHDSQVSDLIRLLCDWAILFFM